MTKSGQLPRIEATKEIAKYANEVKENGPGGKDAAWIQADASNRREG
jgi:hypothetical protein